MRLEGCVKNGTACGWGGPPGTLWGRRLKEGLGFLGRQRRRRLAGETPREVRRCADDLWSRRYTQREPASQSGRAVWIKFSATAAWERAN